MFKHCWPWRPMTQGWDTFWTVVAIACVCGAALLIASFLRLTGTFK